MIEGGSVRGGWSEMIAEGAISLRPVFFDPEWWYQIDTLADLEEAEHLFLDRTHGLLSRSL